jgi:hypothetical protein
MKLSSALSFSTAIRRTVVVAGVATAAVIAPGWMTGASAGTGNPSVDGGGVTTPAQIRPDSAQANAKAEIGAAYLAAATASGASPTRLTTLVSAYTKTYGAAALAARGGGAALLALRPPVPPVVPKAVKLGMKQVPQKKSYYCGPAEGYAMLKWTGPSRAHNNHAKLSQTALASASHMATDKHHGTAWASGKFTHGTPSRCGKERTTTNTRNV